MGFRDTGLGGGWAVDAADEGEGEEGGTERHGVIFG